MLSPVISSTFNNINYISWDRKEKKRWNKTAHKHRPVALLLIISSRPWYCKLPTIMILPGHASLENVDLCSSSNAIQLQAKVSTDTTVFQLWFPLVYSINIYSINGSQFQLLSYHSTEEVQRFWKVVEKSSSRTTHAGNFGPIPQHFLNFFYSCPINEQKYDAWPPPYS